MPRGSTQTATLSLVATRSARGWKSASTTKKDGPAAVDPSSTSSRRAGRRGSRTLSVKRAVVPSGPASHPAPGMGFQSAAADSRPHRSSAGQKVSRFAGQHEACILQPLLDGRNIHCARERIPIHVDANHGLPTTPRHFDRKPRLRAPRALEEAKDVALARCAALLVGSHHLHRLERHAVDRPMGRHCEA